MDLKYEYMVEIELPLPFDNEFISLIPAQRARINELMTAKIISSYAVSIEEGKLWTTMFADTKETVERILSTFPIIDLVDYRICKLVFHNSVGNALPQFSLN